MIFKKKCSFSPASFISFILILDGCSGEKTRLWQFPVKLGDSKEEVQLLLGKPQYKLPKSTIEWYCDSGVSIEYDDFGHVFQINFTGPKVPEAVHLGCVWEPTNRKIVHGISVFMNKREIYEILGNPDNFEEPVFQSLDKVHVWRKPDFLIKIEFWKDKDLISQISVRKIIS